MYLGRSFRSHVKFGCSGSCVSRILFGAAAYPGDVGGDMGVITLLFKKKKNNCTRTTLKNGIPVQVYPCYRV